MPRITKMVNDGWMNLLTGLGLKERDKKQNTMYGGMRSLSYQELELLQRSDGFGKKIVGLIVKHALRNGFSVSGDTDDKTNKYLKTIGFNKKLSLLLKWARGFGGSVMLIGLDDGQTLDQELNEKALKNITYLRVYDKKSVDKTSKVVTEEENVRFGMPEYYGISTGFGEKVWVHWTRIIEVDGEDVVRDVRIQNGGWGDSVLQSVYEALRDVGSVLSGSASIVEDFITGKLHIEGLADMIASGQENLVLKRLNLLDNSKHIINTMLLDTEEKYEKETSNVGGLPDLLDKFIAVLSGMSDIPVRYFIGEQSGGMNNKGEANTRDWYDNVKAYQEETVEPILTKIIYLIGISKESGIDITEESQIKFNPLWQPTQKEEAETRKLTAETDAMYIDRNVLQPAEVAISRFGGEEYSIETKINESDHNNEGFLNEGTQE